MKKNRPTAVPPRLVRILAPGLVLSLLVPMALGAQVNRVILRVNDEIATLYDYEKLKRQQLSALAQADVPEAQKQELAAGIGEQTMRQLFEEMLLLSRADQLGVAVPPDVIDSAMRNSMEGFGIETIEEFAAGLEQSGMTIEGWREQMRRNMVVREVMSREVADRVILEEEDLRRYYRAHAEDFRRPRRVRLREVVVLDGAGLGDAEQQELAEELATAIQRDDGSLEETLTAAEAAGHASGWIDLGWVVEGDLDSALEPVVGRLGAGDVGPPTRARGGLHVLQAVEVEESFVEEFQDVRAQIDETERARLFDEEAQAYMEELLANSYVEAQPPPEAAGFSPMPAARPASEGAQGNG